MAEQTFDPFSLSNFSAVDDEPIKDTRVVNTYDDPLIYKNIINDRQKFRQVLDGFNLLDTPNLVYFKLLFYFFNGDVDNDDNYSGGLLSPTWQLMQNSNVNNNDGTTSVDFVRECIKHTSAWSYLKLNNEEERADKLQKFIELLSNINSKSPWYFQSIEGLDSALERKAPTDGKTFHEDTRKKITIKCLPDAQDDRIGTLLDLYKDITWSWTMKREILPANLRKFDMGLYIFSSPVRNLHRSIKNTDKFIQSIEKINNISNGKPEMQNISPYLTEGDFSIARNTNTSNLPTSYKYIEFHNCEIDYNSGKTGWATLDNANGITPTYSIDIYFDDCYESRYNEIMMRTIGDFITWDMALTTTDFNTAISSLSTKSEAQVDNTNIQKTLDRLDVYKTFEAPESKTKIPSINFLNNIINEAVGSVIRYGKSFLTKAYLGNIFGFSLNNLKYQLQGTSQGHLFSTIGAIQDYSKTIKENKSKKSKTYISNMGNIFKSESIKNNI